ncbi:MAG: ribonuclease HII [Candidatus Thermoplasmatota archaeon]|jgi:ribonuclease HII|nr:ribonuclease HII [Candidatus Thermoplasmatota archaeon]
MIGGLDEAGRGPVIGPLVVAGVVFENDVFLKENNVCDSKKCTPKTREMLAEKIKANAVSYEIVVVSASDIDDLRKVMTLNELEVNIFSRIIDKLRPDFCYVDSADVDDKCFGKDILSKLSFKPEIISKHKADEIYPVVGAASILAKTVRDEHVRKIAVELEPKLGIPLGSGYPADPVTMNFLRAWVDKYGDLPPHTRRSWETAQKLLKNVKIRKLGDF